VHRGLPAAVAALTAAVVAAAPAAGAATKTRCTSALSSAQTTVGTGVTLTGRVRPKRARPVRLQVRDGATWRTVARKRSSKAGRFALSVPAAAAGVLPVRAQVPAAKGARRANCATRTLTVTAAEGGSNQDAAPAHAWRAVYALASDQVADAGKPAAIAGTAGAVNGWFGTQTIGGVQPRWQRNADGTLAVTTVTLGHTVAQYAAAGDNFDLIAQDLALHDLPAAGHQEKIAVYIDVTNSAACGASSGDVVLMFEAACDIHPGADDVFPYGATYLLAHEMAHGFGAVDDCAPHAGGGGHVIDDPRDLLYNGDQDRVWDQLALDPGHDDYYATGRADCPGIEASPFWDAAADSAG
jgi:hypothetical protein